MGKRRFDRVIIALVIIMMAVALITGCSGGSTPVDPVVGPSADVAGSHNTWGIWQFAADPQAGTLDVVMLRTGDMHVNVLPFLEPPAFLNLTLESLQFNGDIIEADIGLRHPFIGLVEFTGFDVAGILISNGSVSGFDDPDLIMAGVGETRLLNPDGYSRWWNPAEFPADGTMFGYKDGLLGAPDSTANFTSTLNGYKFYCDDLTNPDASVSTLDPSSRCVFSPGVKNIRHYSIQLGAEGLVFNYAVDANWHMPTGTPPWTAPDDFGPDANRTEAWNIVVTEVENTLWNDGTAEGGNLNLDIDIWDHFDGNLNIVHVESAGNFVSASSGTAVDGGVGYSTYDIDIADATPAAGTIELFITVASEAVGYQGLLPGKTISSYFKYTAQVSPDNPGPTACGTGSFTGFTGVSFTGTDTGRPEIANLINGPYAGQTLIPSAPNEISRYNLQTIGSLSGTVFITIPPASAGAWGNIYHIDVCPVSGRVIVVSDGLGANNSLLVFDNQGSLLTSTSGITMGSGRKIYGVYPNNNGDLWVLTTGNASFSQSWDSRLERWTYQAGSPFYVHDTASDLATDTILGTYYGYGWRILNDLSGFVVVWETQRIFVLRCAEIGEHNGKLYIFDINASGPPTYNGTLSNMSLFAEPTWRSFWDDQRTTNGTLFIDQSDVGLGTCRIIGMSRTYPDWLCQMVRLDGDGNVLSQMKYTNIYDPYTVGISSGPAHNMITVNYFTNQTYMAPKPADW